ncbi:cytidine deaminase [Aurantiacibacter spongiae]|nr:cytidine deaminase [Aurantiacibacter spongiae]
MSAPNALIDAARTARSKAHAPYSHFLVGCAVESTDGQIAVGANMENACYRLGICAEQSALAAAAQTFGLANVRRILVLGGPQDGAADGSAIVTPCGGCRQAIQEAAALSNLDIEVVCCDRSGNNRTVTTIGELLPAAFSL